MQPDFQIATTLAADLAGSRVDPNEAQKALAYLRSKRDPKQFFEYLRAITQNGRAVIRSGQTMGYYRDLLAACERHLRNRSADDMMLTLGWAIRLLRYYRAVPDAERPQVTTSRQTGQRPQPAGQRSQQAVHQEQSASAEPPAPKGPQLPEVGTVFTGEILDDDGERVALEVPGFTQEQALGVINSDVRGTRQYRIGNRARVEVVGVRKLKSGKTIVELKPAPQSKK